MSSTEIDIHYDGEFDRECNHAWEREFEEEWNHHCHGKSDGDGTLSILASTLAKGKRDERSPVCLVMAVEIH